MRRAVHGSKEITALGEPVWPARRTDRGIGLVLGLLLAAWLAVACSPGALFARSTFTPTPVPPLPRSMKGYELYSWQDGQQWRFTLITGTNRTKTLEEITTGEDALTADGWVNIHVQGLAAIQSVVSRIPPGEWLSWIGPQ